MILQSIIIFFVSYSILKSFLTKAEDLRLSKPKWASLGCLGSGLVFLLISNIVNFIFQMIGAINFFFSILSITFAYSGVYLIMKYMYKKMEEEAGLHPQKGQEEILDDPFDA